MTWRNSACMSIGRVTCPDTNTLVSPIGRKRPSAIDDFYASTSTAVTRVDPDFIALWRRRCWSDLCWSYLFDRELLQRHSRIHAHDLPRGSSAFV